MAGIARNDFVDIEVEKYTGRNCAWFWRQYVNEKAKQLLSLRTGQPTFSPNWAKSIDGSQENLLAGIEEGEIVETHHTKDGEDAAV